MEVNSVQESKIWMRIALKHLALRINTEQAVHLRQKEFPSPERPDMTRFPKTLPPLFVDSPRLENPQGKNPFSGGSCLDSSEFISFAGGDQSSPSLDLVETLDHEVPGTVLKDSGHFLERRQIDTRHRRRPRGRTHASSPRSGRPFGKRARYTWLVKYSDSCSRITCFQTPARTPSIFGAPNTH